MFRKLSLTLSLLLATSVMAESDHWAVLVAGSNGYWNYRHQADVFHAYHAIVAKGVPKENIIVFAYDDIAEASNNPFKGKVFNHPDGEDVYAGVTIDYRGRDVTPENFLSVITGDASAVSGVGSGKVLKSTSNSKVFINFSDHGAPGLIAFPHSYLYADKFMDAITKMHTSNMYERLVIYIEACESGSMFEGKLPSDINVYATTAANAHESSWGYYCSPQDVVKGIHLRTCLGDLYSIAWMEDTDAAPACSKTLAAQYKDVKERTSKSEVCEFGTTSFKDKDYIDRYQGNCADNSAFESRFLHQQESAAEKREKYAASAVNSRDAKLHHLYANVMHEPSNKAHLDLIEELNQRMKADNFFEAFGKDQASAVNGEEFPLPTKFECLRALMETYEEHCGKFTDYSLKYVKYLVKECESMPEIFSMEPAYAKIRAGCPK